MISPKQIVLDEIRKHVPEATEYMVKDVPPEVEGDYSFPCFAYAKKAGLDPQKTAERIAQNIDNDLILRAEANKGFLNIFLDAKKVGEKLIGEVAKTKEKFGFGSKTGRLIVEHTSANPNAPLHVGHLRNSIIGDSISRILSFAGHDVESQFFVNDMGGQLAILASFLDLNDYEESLKNSKKKPDAWLGEMYVQANREVDPEVAKALQKNYERGGKEIIKIFDFMVRTALSGVKQTFSDYGVSLDTFVRESDFVFGGSVGEILEKFKQTPYWFEKEGFSALDLREFGIKKELVLLRSDGTTLYTTRDIAYHVWKLKAGDCINVIANEQSLQQQQLRAALKILGVKDVDKRVSHLSYEFVTVPGIRMSSRTGEYISADDLLAEGIRRSREEIDSRDLDIDDGEKDKIAKAIAVGAIRFNMVKITPLKPIEFRWEDALNFEGESAPYLQYSHARACRILEKVQNRADKNVGDFLETELSYEDDALILAMARFAEVVSYSAEELKPNLLANYLIQLAEAFNRFYFKCPVLDADENLRAARLTLVSTFRQIMSNGLGLLGIEALERM